MFQKQLYVQKLHKIKPKNTYKVYNTHTRFCFVQFFRKRLQSYVLMFVDG